MKIINTALEGKGGIGASTTAVNLCIELSKNNNVLMIDIDENKHTTKFNIAREDSKKFNTLDDVDTQQKLEDELEQFGHLYDYIIIDSGKYKNKLNSYARQVSDIIIVPTTDSDSDYIQAQDFIEKLREEVIAENDYTKVMMLVNKVRWNSSLFHREMKEAYKDTERVGVFETVIIDHPKYKKMALSGKGVCELTDNVRVNDNISDLATEVEVC